MNVAAVDLELVGLHYELYTLQIGFGSTWFDSVVDQTDHKTSGEEQVDPVEFPVGHIC